MKNKKIRKLDFVCIVAAVCAVTVLMFLLRKGGPFDAQSQKTVAAVTFEERQIALSKEEQQLIVKGVLSDIRRYDLNGTKYSERNMFSKVQVKIEAEGYCGMQFDAYLQDGALVLQNTEFVLPEQLRSLLKEKSGWQGDLR